MLAPDARRRSVTLTMRVEEDVPAAYDRHHMQQVVLNLVSNSLQAVEEGGTITVSIRPEKHGPEAWTVLTVEDDGPGIAPEHLARVFEPFFTTKGVDEGTGLGLSVSYGIVRDHGGRIEVESIPGTRTRFRVFLPQNLEGEASDDGA